MLENMRIFIPEKVLMYTFVEMKTQNENEHSKVWLYFLK